MIRIFTFTFNRPEFLEWQKKTFDKFLQDPFELIVINHGANEEMKAQIETAAKKLNLKSIQTPDNLLKSSASVSHSSAVQWCYDEVVLKEYVGDKVALIDHDIFMVKPFSIKDFLKDHDYAGIWQYRQGVLYQWTGLLFIDTESLPNKERFCMLACIHRGVNLDSGGALARYMGETPNVRVKRIEHTSHVCEQNKNLYVLPKQVLDKYDENFKIEFEQSSFLHLGGMSWGRQDSTFEKRKIEFMHWLLTSCLNDEIKMEEIKFVFNE